MLVCSAALAAIVLIAVPGGRTFASEMAAKFVHLRPGATAGPIPFILDLHRHKRAHKAPAQQQHATPGKSERSGPKSHAPTARRSAAPSR